MDVGHLQMFEDLADHPGDNRSVRVSDIQSCLGDVAP